MRAYMRFQEPRFTIQENRPAWEDIEYLWADLTIAVGRYLEEVPSGSVYGERP